MLGRLGGSEQGPVLFLVTALQCALASELHHISKVQDAIFPKAGWKGEHFPVLPCDFSATLLQSDLTPL